MRKKTERQFRSWWKNKLGGCAARADYRGSSMDSAHRRRVSKLPPPYRFKVPQLIENLEFVLSEAKAMAKNTEQTGR